MFIFYEGKGLQTVFNDITVGEQNPLAELGGPSSLFKLREVHLREELDVFLTSSSGSSHVSCMHRRAQMHAIRNAAIGTVLGLRLMMRHESASTQVQTRMRIEKLT